MPDPINHRRFAAIWDFTTKHESKAERELRCSAAGSATGRILELGVGVGANWPYLPSDADYVGIEPDRYMLRRARKRAESLNRDFTLERARAEDLPFEDGEFDTVLVTWTLCTVQDPAKALAEAARVLKPGGRLLFAEHVRPEGKVAGPVMDALTPVWRRLFGGCHPNRRTEAAITDAGLEIAALERRRVSGLPMISGTARKPQ